MSEKRIIDKTLHTIPNLMGMMIAIADELFFDLAEESREQHTYDPELVQKCCQYLFKKAFEAVNQWGHSTDGNIDIYAGIIEAVSENVKFERDSKTCRTFELAEEFGTALFESHSDYIESQTQYSGELFMVELVMLFRWCIILGTSFAIEKKWYKRIPNGQKIETIIPTAETFEWVRNFLPIRNE